MKKREFIKTSTILTVGALTVPLGSCQNSASKDNNTESNDSNAVSDFTLPALSYEHSALEPYIDSMTMEIHHGKHHAGYVRKLNNALKEHALSGKALEEIVSSVGEEDTAVRNNGGGHYNHSLFWKIMKPSGASLPEGNLRDAIDSGFGSFEEFESVFSKAAKTRFGSGWAWLSVDSDKKLFVSSTPNQDNPMMSNLVEKSGVPILGIDVWEHAYYLKYQNKRADYISSFLNVINWEEVAAMYGALV